MRLGILGAVCACITRSCKYIMNAIFCFINHKLNNFVGAHTVQASVVSFANMQYTNRRSLFVFMLIFFRICFCRLTSAFLLSSLNLLACLDPKVASLFSSIVRYFIRCCPLSFSFTRPSKSSVLCIVVDPYSLNPDLSPSARMQFTRILGI
jgi:hypothetical protein